MSRKKTMAVQNADEAGATPATADVSDETPRNEKLDQSGRPTADAPQNGDVAEEAPAAPNDPAAELGAKVESLEESLLRAKADYQNLLRRSTVERAEAIRYANAELIRSLLGVVDDLERSLAAAEQSDDAGSLKDGVRLAHENFMKTLRSHGLEPISALHEPFDPSIHNAMMQRPSPDDPPGTVVEEITRGYRLWDRVLRPAMVIVSKAEDAKEDPEQDVEETRASDGSDADADVRV